MEDAMTKAGSKRAKALAAEQLKVSGGAFLLVNLDFSMSSLTTVDTLSDDVGALFFCPSPYCA